MNERSHRGVRTGAGGQWQVVVVINRPADWKSRGTYGRDASIKAIARGKG